MDNGVGRDSAERVALSVGLSVTAQREDGVPALGALDPLDQAPARAASVSEALVRFGYTETWRPDETTDLSEKVRNAVRSTSTQALVVHIVAHGRLAETGERELHVVASDGTNLDDPVSSWISLIESHPDKPRPRTLFILDLCNSGAAATLSWQQQMQVGERRAWVIAASGREDKAFGYRLSRATAMVLGHYLDGTLAVDSSYQHIPLPTVAHEIAREVAKLSETEGFAQQVDVSRVPFTARIDHLPFFPNPGYTRQESLLPEVDAGIASMLDEAFDARHFMLRGASAEPLDRGDSGQGYFRGRDAEVRALTAWFNGQGSGFRLLTGKPGVGKSALLGVLVCAAHPTLRGATQNLWHSLPAKPGRNERLAVVHARRRDLTQVSDSLARQMGAAEKDRPADGWDAQSLLELAQSASDAPYTVVIDALDEAERPEDVTQALLLPLVREALKDSPRIRLLVGTRSDRRFATLTQFADASGGWLDLNHVQPHDLYESLQEYVGALLAIDTSYAAAEAGEAARALAEGIATRLTGVNAPSQDAAGEAEPLAWGEFLAAGLYVRHVLSLPTECNPALARELGLAAPVDLAELLELDLVGRGDQPHLRPVLAALAYAEGRGIPERALAHVAPAFMQRESSGGPLPTDSLREALEQARFYLRRDIDVDGTTLYRLFHEGLAERLRAGPYSRQGQEQTG
ncbi:ATP-binding protein [Streptomyces sp. NBC_01142]|uniref:ATP-binding protein n=1 Tax=Streptomyces sp. NBC_01142 TaxID=2975865 RepID=UPI00225AAEE6|nr:ATP-binding protein [Streptomyces sp. NBC_01142]MCX4826843.1 ATP-binding protein [Streptomyces sp. NBC_01142]